jgi:hypothetical protein
VIDKRMMSDLAEPPKTIHLNGIIDEKANGGRGVRYCGDAVFNRIEDGVYVYRVLAGVGDRLCLVEVTVQDFLVREKEGS